MFIIQKILFFLFCLSTLNIGKHIINLILELRKEQPERIRFTKKELFILGLSISYILTIIFTGFK